MALRVGLGLSVYGLGMEAGSRIRMRFGGMLQYSYNQEPKGIMPLRMLAATLHSSLAQESYTCSAGDKPVLVCGLDSAQPSNPVFL